MKTYDVQISEKALNDMDAVYTYIAENLHAPNAAMNQYNRIADAILSLEQNPARIKVMDSESERSLSIRKMDIDNYSVFFVIKSEIVSIIRVLYSASDISKRLFEN